MTAQEQQMIQDLADRIHNTPLAEKDPDAEQFLQQSLGRNQDALYILAQTVLVQQYALDQAQKQLADAKAQLDQQQHQPKHATSFLGNLLGLGEDANRQPPPQSQQPNYPPYTPVPPYDPYRYGAPAPGYGPPPPVYPQPQSGGFLRSAMQTATGVAAGALAFEGIESLMHGFGGSGGSSAFSSGGRPEEIVNNYYGDSKPETEHKDSLFPDIEDRRHESAFDNAVDKDDHGKQGFLGDDDSDKDTGTSDDTVSDTAYDSSFDDDSSSDTSDDNF